MEERRERETRRADNGDIHFDGAPRRRGATGAPGGGEFHLDRRIVAQAERQLGNLTREQLEDAGLNPTAIDHWVRRGRLYLRHRGVYTLAGLALPKYSAQLAVVLAYGPNTLLSHASAA